MTSRNLREFVLIAGLLAVVSPEFAYSVQQQEQPEYSNLRVLPEGISRRDLGRVMQQNLRGLGLPRRQSQGCLFCHVGDSEQPSGTWDWASDRKPEKVKAREMMEMVAEINSRLAGLDDRIAPDLEVTCYTCHAGRTDPRPLPDVLASSYEMGGVDSLTHTYRRLRNRYFGADAYDFRSGVLSNIAIGLGDAGHYEDALAVSAMNEEFFPESMGVVGVTVLIRLEREFARFGLEAAFAEFGALVSSNAAFAVPDVLDGFGWRLSRKDFNSEALLVFDRNLELFPDEYIPNESRSDAYFFIEDDLEAAIAGFESWLERNPGHVMATRRLATLKAERE